LHALLQAHCCLAVGASTILLLLLLLPALLVVFMVMKLQVQAATSCSQ
jgi:hypothetical protein